MTYDIIYGEGDHGCSAHKIFGLNTAEHISENKACYWIDACLLDIQLIVFKNTSEGKNLKKLIDERDDEKISTYITQLVLSSSPKIILIKIIEYGERRFKEGIVHNQTQIKAQLGIHE